MANERQELLKNLLISTSFKDEPYAELTLQERIILKNTAGQMRRRPMEKEAQQFLAQRENFFKYLVVKNLFELDPLFCLSSQITRSPWVVCDSETFADQVWIYSSQETAEKGAKELMEKEKSPLSLLTIPKEQITAFFLGLRSIGVNEVVLDKAAGKPSISIELDRIIKKPDLKNLPDPQRRLAEAENPELFLTALYYAQKNAVPNDAKNVDELKELQEEMIAHLKKGNLVIPLDFPKKEEGETIDKKDSRIPLFKMQNGDIFVPVCTDGSEFMKINREAKYGFVIAGMDQIRKMCPEEVKGILLNPASVAIGIPKAKL